jgi:hypothetical protein
VRFPVACACILALTACVISQNPAPPPTAPPAPSPSYCPAPVWPDAVTEEWYAKAKLPVSVEEWINRLMAQQADIEKHCGGTHKPITRRKAP